MPISHADEALWTPPFEVLPLSRRFYIGDQHGAAVERGTTYATREEAERRIREMRDAMEEDQ